MSESPTSMDVFSVASRIFFPGLTTMLHSLSKHETRPLVRHVHLLQHDNFSDTLISEREWSEVKCSWNASISRARVSDVFAAQVSAIDRSRGCSSTVCNCVPETYLKIYVIISCRSPLCLYLDTDTIVLNPIDISKLLNSHPGFIHGFGNGPHLQSGVFALRPLPTTKFVTLANVTPTPTCDQNVLNSMFKGRLVIHKHLRINYRPLKNASSWVLAHWQGAEKPWGANSVTLRKEHVRKDLLFMWRALRSEQQSKCNSQT